MFNKNIKALSEFNSELAESLLKITLEKAQEDVTAHQAKSGEPIIAYKDNYLDDIEAPFTMAKSIILNQISDDFGKNDVIIIYGMGLGYFFKRAFTEFPSKILIFEPKIEILRFIFEYVDFSEEIKQKRVRFFNNEDAFAKFLETTYLTNDKIELVYNPGYINIFTNEMLKFGEKILKICEEKNNDINTIKNQSKHWVLNTLMNAHIANNARPLSVLKGLFKDKNALILAAGPSLKDNIEKIKEYRENFVIFSVNKSLNFLIKNGVIPDFVVVADRYIADTIDIINTLNKKPHIITTNQADFRSYNKMGVQIFIYYLQTTNQAKMLKERFPNFIDMYDITGTSVSECYFSAVEMGFKNIVFAGLDLALKENVAYATGEALEITDETKKVTVGTQEKNIVKIKSVTGQEIYTRDDYKIFIDQLSDIFSKDKDHYLFNISSFGAYINGMDYKPLENIISDIKNTNNRYELAKIPDIVKISEQKWEEVFKFQQGFLRKMKSDIENFDKTLNNFYKKIYKIQSNNHSINIQEIKNEELKIIKAITNHIILSTFFQAEMLKYIEENKNNKNPSTPMVSIETIRDISEQLSNLNEWYNKCIKNP